MVFTTIDSDRGCFTDSVLINLSRKKTDDFVYLEDGHAYKNIKYRVINSNV